MAEFSCKNIIMTDSDDIIDQMDTSCRPMEKIKELANLAGVTMGKGLVQSISYSNDWMKGDYKLLELNKELISSLQEGDEVVIRGEQDDDTVLCSKDKTFDLRAADTSNTLLLIPDLASPDTPGFLTNQCVSEKSVLSCFSSYYEARLIQPRLDRLKAILEEDAYSGPEESNLKKYDTDGLLNSIQSSKEELMNALRHLGALLIDGFWRVLDLNYRDKAFAQILALIEENKWDWHRIPKQLTCETLEELYPDFILTYCLQLYGNIVNDENEDEEINEGDKYCLDEEKVCQYYADYILRPAMGKFNYFEFMEAWEQSVPDGMRINEAYLRGVALTDLKTHPPVIWHFPEKKLPEDPKARFEVLFKTRAKWKEEDIVPYVKNVVPPGQKLNSLFLKYARCSTEPNGGKVYNSKQPIS